MIKRGMRLILLSIVILTFITMTVNTYAMSTGEEILNSTQATELVQMRESAKDNMQEYIDKYGSVPFGYVAAILDIVRIYSIPLCFLGIALGSIFQYVLGIRKLDVRDRGFMLIITFVTILMICQVLPLIFAIIVNGWRG